MQKPGFTAMEDKGVTVVLDTNLSDELIREGYAREVISKLQTMRKDSGFEVTDHIAVSITGNDKLAALVQKNEAELKAVTLADSIGYDQPLENAKEWNINGEKVTLGVQKA